MTFSPQNQTEAQTLTHSIYTVLYSMKSNVIVTQDYFLGVIKLGRRL